MINLTNPQIGIFSDIHIGLGQDSLMWHEIIINFAHWVKELYFSQNINDIFILGDVFHNRDKISVNTLNIAKEFFEILKDFNLYILAGNHDCYYKDRADINSISLLKHWRNITIADTNPLLLKYKDKNISLIPWGTPLEQIPNTNICFGHFEINSFAMNTHKICTQGIESESLLNKASLILSGHFHKKNYRKYSKGEIYYTGSPYQQNFGDTDDERGVYILNLNDCELKFYENKTSPRHVKVSINQLIKGTQTADFLKNSIPNNLVSLIIDCNLSQEKITLISSKIQNLNPKFFRIDYKVTDDNEINFEQGSYSSIDIPKSIEDFVNTMDFQYKEEVVNYLNHLYNKILS
jgi:DNA repair exonuclease SbcCD nuclease subunit